jgi:hypothetical protein
MSMTGARSYGRWRDWSEQLAANPGGRIALSVVIIVLVVSTIAWNLAPGNGPASAPGSPALRRDLLTVGAPVMYALGLDQVWSVFAPPRLQVIGLEARIEYADGTSSVWRPPTSTGDVVGAYRDYHWGKYVEEEIPDSSAFLWGELAAWVARTHTSPGHRPVSLELIRRWYDLYPVRGGRGPTHGPWKQYTYYTYIVPAARGR